MPACFSIIYGRHDYHHSKHVKRQIGAGPMKWLIRRAERQFDSATSGKTETTETQQDSLKELSCAELKDRWLAQVEQSKEHKGQPECTRVNQVPAPEQVQSSEPKDKLQTLREGQQKRRSR